MDHLEHEVYTQYKYNKKPKRIIEQIIAVVKTTQPNAKILSVGCGDGYVERYVMEHTNRNIAGLDVSPKGLALARKRGLEVYQGSAYELPFPDETIDLILAIHLFEHLVHPEIFLKEIHRVLKHNGHFFMSLPNYGNLAYRVKYLLKGSLDTFLQIRLGHYRHYTYRETCRYLEQNNFKIIRKMTFLFGSQFIFIRLLPKIHKNLFSFSTLLLTQPRKNLG